MSFAFNVLGGTGYFFFSGVTNFGDWAVVILGLRAHWFWRTLLVAGGISSYFAAAIAVGIGLIRYVGVPRNASARMRRLTFIPYFSSIFILSAAGLLNPVKFQLVWQSALPATAGANSGLLWMKFYIPSGIVPERESDGIGRSYLWIGVAVVMAAVFIFVLGRGITLHR